MKALEKAFPDSFVWKPCDSFNLGIPDIHAALPPTGKLLVAEAKQVPKLFKLKGMFEIDQERGLLKHCFTGPQISMLRRLSKAGAEAYGLVRTHDDIAYRLHPQSIPLDGQVTPKLLFNWGQVFTRDDGWKFWKHEVG